MATDVNEAFATEKRTQLDQRRADRDARIKAQADRAAKLEADIASGRLVSLGGNRYRVTEGWDAGETITVRRNSVGQVAEVVAEHGLDVAADGTVALYSAVPTWHGLGQIIPGGTTSIDEVLRLAQIDWEVAKREVRYSFMADGEDKPTLRTAPGSFVTVREDTGAALGVVGTKYTPIQQRRIFGFLEELVSQGVLWQSAGPLDDGRRVFVSLKVPENIVVDAGGINDEIQLFIVALNSHDGRSKAETVVTPWRPVCRNTERFAVRDAVTRWGIRHTSGALDRLEEARRSLGLTLAYGKSWAEEENTLAQTNIVLDEFDKLIADLWPPSEEEEPSTRTQGIADRRRERLHDMFATESERLGRTAYAAERTITDYLDNVAPRRPGKSLSLELARASAALVGVDDDVKTKAHKRLMLLARR
ncbi:DUF932 domain-containing protein [Acrocarpospora catenulata]|uniref:DUF932 domain-containing protein n=1 Tax=Acrocarpospora catenulata TaxID=2836182 RepID=UPI001BDA2426|nr:DUF932 domain-containing protein [Acrocarpospora catenulata]